MLGVPLPSDATLQPILDWASLEPWLYDSEIEVRKASLALMKRARGFFSEDVAKPATRRLTIDWARLDPEEGNVLTITETTRPKVARIKTSSGDLVAIAGFDSGLVAIWDAIGQRRVSICSSPGHVLSVTGLQGLTGRPILAVATTANQVTLWDGEFGSYIATIRDAVNGVSAMGDAWDIDYGPSLLTGGTDDGLLRMWNIVDGTLIRSISFEGKIVACASFVQGPGICVIVATNLRGSLRAFNLQTDQMYYLAESVYDFRILVLEGVHVVIWFERNILRAAAWNEIDFIQLNLSMPNGETLEWKTVDDGMSGVLTAVGDFCIAKIRELQSASEPVLTQGLSVCDAATIESGQGVSTIFAFNDGTIRVIGVNQALHSSIDVAPASMAQISPDRFVASFGPTGKTRATVYATDSGEVLGQIDKIGAVATKFLAVPTMSGPIAFMAGRPGGLGWWSESARLGGSVEGIHSAVQDIFAFHDHGTDTVLVLSENEGLSIVDLSTKTAHSLFKVDRPLRQAWVSRRTAFIALSEDLAQIIVWTRNGGRTSWSIGLAADVQIYSEWTESGDLYLDIKTKVLLDALVKGGADGRTAAWTQQRWWPIAGLATASTKGAPFIQSDYVPYRSVDHSNRKRHNFYAIRELGRIQIGGALDVVIRSDRTLEVLSGSAAIFRTVLPATPVALSRVGDLDFLVLMSTGVAKMRWMDSNDQLAISQNNAS